MANDINNADRLIERILSDAREDAEKTAGEAKEGMARVAELAGHDIWEIELDAKLKADKLRESILERSRTNAALDSRKYALTAKRNVVAEAFSAAARALLALSGAERDALLTSCALREAEGGETIRPARADYDAIKRLLPDINAGLAKNGRAALALGEACEAEGGFSLVGGSYEKNCSFSAMLREVQEREESRVADILFE